MAEEWGHGGQIQRCWSKGTKGTKLRRINKPRDAMCNVLSTVNTLLHTRHLLGEIVGVLSMHKKSI